VITTSCRSLVLIAPVAGEILVERDMIVSLTRPIDRPPWNHSHFFVPR
jgi:hypothetical protein